jgi:hypothetical protein
VPVLRENGYVPTDIAVRLRFTCYCEDPYAMGVVNHPAITAALPAWRRAWGRDDPAGLE